MIHLLVILSVIYINVNAQDCPNIVSRREWKAMSPSHTDRLVTPVSYVTIHSTTGAPCSFSFTCQRAVRNLQSTHMMINRWEDIGYNFLVGNNGIVYEGRGWTTLGESYFKAYNLFSLSVAFIGSYDDKAPSSAAQNALQQLIACGVARNFVKENYILRGHGIADCPGEYITKTIQNWSHYKS